MTKPIRPVVTSAPGRNFSRAPPAHPDALPSGRGLRELRRPRRPAGLPWFSSEGDSLVLLDGGSCEMRSITSSRPKTSFGFI